MKNLIKIVLGSALTLVTTGVSHSNYLQQGYNYGNSYTYGTYGYGQGYQGSAYQSNYYGQGYGGYSQGYQGYYGGGYQSGMGNNFAYVDNNWIEDQLRFAVTDVNQNRPYSAMQKLNSLSSYVQGFGDSELYRRVQLAIRLGYKSSLKNEIQTLYNDWKGGKMRLGWESGANQSYNGQDDISKEYVISQLNLVIADLNGNNQNRGRQRLYGLQSAIPPMGNDRLVRRVYYAASVNRPSQMKSEVQNLIQEIQSGSIVLNDTENNPYNYYYGYGTTNPYNQPDQGYPGGGYNNPPAPYDNGFPPFGEGSRYDMGYGQPTNELPSGNQPGPGTIYYPPGYEIQPPVTNLPQLQQDPSTGGSVPVAPQPVPAAPSVSLEQLQANVAAAYSKLKEAISSGDRDQIQQATDAYKKAQRALESAKAGQ